MRLLLNLIDTISRGAPAEDLHLHLYRYADAVHYLLYVIAGLDSLVLGESQILGLVTRA
jgi:glutamyl-tRNA reductase